MEGLLFPENQTGSHISFSPFHKGWINKEVYPFTLFCISKVFLKNMTNHFLWGMPRNYHNKKEIRIPVIHMYITQYRLLFKGLKGQLYKRMNVCPGPEVIKLFPCSTQLSMKFFLLINVKMPTIVGSLTFMSWRNSIINLSEPGKKLIFLIFFYLFAFKISCSAEFSMNFFFMKSGPGDTLQN